MLEVYTRFGAGQGRRIVCPGALRKAGREAEARTAFERVKQLKSMTAKSEIDVLSPERNH
jgi:hypothetical protein